MASEPDVIQSTPIAVALVLLVASVGCAGLGAGTGSLRISDIADQGDAERRASQQLVLDGLDSDINLLPDVALRQYETAIQVDPTNPYGYLAIARHHVDSEDPRRALPFLDQSEALLRAHPDTALATHAIARELPASAARALDAFLVEHGAWSADLEDSLARCAESLPDHVRATVKIDVGVEDFAR